MKKILLTVVAIAGLFTAQAQIKEGSITYSVTVDGMPPEQAAMMKGMELNMAFKDKKSRVEFSSSMMSSTTVSDDDGSLTLMDGMGMKSFTKLNKEDLEKENKKNPEPKITYTEEKKTIATYDCKKAVIEVKDQKGEAQKLNVWYTEKLPNNGGGRMGQFKGLKGAPLEFETNQGPMKMRMTATKVSLSPIADSQFKLSTDGYTEMKMEDLQKMRGGSGK
jgi:GLPGLI family protein